MLLTDEEIMAAGYNSGDPDGVLEFGKNVIAAYEAKLREQNEPIYLSCYAGQGLDWLSKEQYDQTPEEYRLEFFKHPAPIPKSLTLFLKSTPAITTTTTPANSMLGALS